MKTIAIIPGRGGSKGLPRKNVRTVDGIPLVAYPVQQALASGAVDRVFVTTDDEEIAAAGRAAGAEVPFLRDPELARDETTMEATLRAALLSFEHYTGEQFDIAVLLTPTEFFRNPDWITRAVTLLKERPELESAFTAQAVYKNFWEPLPEGGYQRVRTYMQIYGQRQERLRNGRLIYREDTGMVCASRAWLWRQGRRIGDRVELILTQEHEHCIDIHSEYDLYMAEQSTAWRKNHDPH